jgi:hypothetical protein
MYDGGGGLGRRTSPVSRESRKFFVCPPYWRRRRKGGGGEPSEHHTVVRLTTNLSLSLSQWVIWTVVFVNVIQSRGVQLKLILILRKGAFCVNLSQNICSFFCVLIVPQRWTHRKILTILLCCPKPVSGWKFCNFYWKNVKVRSDDFTARCRIFCSPLSINLSQNICSLLSPKGGADPKNSDHFVLCPKPVSGWKFVLEKVRSDLHGTIG